MSSLRERGSGGVRGAVMAREGVGGGEYPWSSVNLRVSCAGSGAGSSKPREEVGDLGLLGPLVEGAV